MTGEQLDKLAELIGITRQPAVEGTWIIGDDDDTPSLIGCSVNDLLYKIMGLDGVEDCTIQEIYSKGQVEICVDGGNDEDIARVLFDFLPMGISTSGNHTIVHSGIMGISQYSIIRPDVQSTDDRYPHTCPHCNASAYIGGDGTVDCSKCDGVM
jgi:hypothetical protein